MIMIYILKTIYLKGRGRGKEKEDEDEENQGMILEVTDEQEN